MTRNQGALIGRVGSFSELLKFTVLSDVLASATSICDKVDKSVRFLMTLLKKRRQKPRSYNRDRAFGCGPDI